jgi:thiamine kinase-like enzyme
MNAHLKDLILRSTGARSLTIKEQVQELWSGYGKILRVSLEGAKVQSVVVKHVQIPSLQNHPRGWNTDLSHQRKLKSYQVEMNWYQQYSRHCIARLPYCYTIEQKENQILMVLEDLDESGFSLRKTKLEWEEIEDCLKWLAQFHASYLGIEPKGLWQVGTYWHLDTRPHELSALQDEKLKAAASLIDQKLNACRFKTLVHGDAKLANFCFSPNGSIAAVDFQYVGGGCGMKDVAYFIGSCMDETNCERLEEKILDTYFASLQQALRQKNEPLEREWRALYRLAWADFHRFLKGWSPDHWKINSYSERVVREVIENL